MADGLNKVMLLGNLGADPELRMTGGGQAVLNMRIATTSSYLDRNNARQERTEWHSVALWGKRGEALAKILTKGERIYVEGELRTSSYEKDGEKRYRTEISATNVILCGSARGGDSDRGGDSRERSNGNGNGGGRQQSLPNDRGGNDRGSDRGNGGGSRGGGNTSRGNGGNGGGFSSPPPKTDDWGDYGGGDDEIPF